MQITSNLLFILLRIALLLLVWYYINLKLVKKTTKLNIFDFIVKKGFVYGSLLVLFSFLLLLLGIYDFLNSLLLLSVFSLFSFYNFKSPKHIYGTIFRKIKLFLLLNLRRIEKKEFLKKTFYVFMPNKRKKEILISIGLFFLIGGICFWSRSYFFQYDQFSLSDLWFQNLGFLNDVKNQHWLLDNNEAFGSFIFIDFLGTITHQIPEMSLYVFGVLESIALCVVLYWTVLSIGNTKKTIALLTALIFAVCYMVLPLNLSFINQSKSILLALLFVIPLLVYLLNPKMLTTKKLVFYSFVFASLFTIASISLFIYFMVLLPLLGLIIILGTNKQRLYSFYGILLYLLVILIYSMIYYFNGVDILSFLKSNLISVSSYTHAPHLILPLKVLLHGIQLISILALLVTLLFYWLKKDNNKAIIILLLFYNFLAMLTYMPVHIIDLDLLIQVFAVFIPLTLGISLAVFTRLFKPILKEQLLLKRFVLPTATLIMFLLMTFAMNKGIRQNLQVVNQFAPKILKAYSIISHSYLPYSYAVVNDKSMQSFSSQKHYYISFEDFNNTYEEKDELYYIFKEKEPSFKNNPDLVLPKSILVFVYKEKSLNNTLSLSTSIKTMNNTKVLLSTLSKKKRFIRLLYENENFKILEIVNEPNSSRISELLLY